MQDPTWADLGIRLATFQDRKLPWLVSASAGLLALLLGGLALVSLTWSPAGAQSMRLAFLGAGFVLTGALLVLRARASGGVRVTAFESGLIWQSGPRSLSLRWADVAEVFRQGKPCALLVLDNGGWCFSFEPRLANFEELCRLIERSTLPHLLPAARLSVVTEVGGFGPLRVRPEGLECEGRLLTWPELGPVEFSAGFVCVHEAQGGRPVARVESERVRNLHVLLQLIEEGRRGALANRATRTTH